MLRSWLGRWPRIVIRRKGGEIAASSRVVSLSGWSHLSSLRIEDHVYIGPEARIFALGGVEIGAGSIIGPRLTVYSSNHDFFSAESIPYSNSTVRTKRVVVGKGCWLGDSVMLLPGVTLGDHCLVGAGTVVRGDHPAGSILGGNPAKVVGSLSDAQLTAKYTALTNRRFHIGGPVS